MKASVGLKVAVYKGHHLVPTPKRDLVVYLDLYVLVRF
jgi:hypothetical protein